MHDQHEIDRFDEALRLIYLDQVRAMDTEQVHQELSSVLANSNRTISSGKEQEMLSRLSALMQQRSFGQLMEQAMKENSIGEELLVEKTGLTPAMIYSLRKDALYPNNVPIQLFKKLVMSLKLSYSMVRTAALKTFGQLKNQVELSEATATGFTPAFRKEYEQISSGHARKDSDTDGNELFENEEALNKYLNRLEELLTE